MKQLAKAALDWMSAAAAVKYYRGGFGGPTKRDYKESTMLSAPCLKTGDESEMVALAAVKNIQRFSGIL
ncbi:MAG: hypothetical protein F6K37_17375 [Moorea sp. SIO4E2]|nr:hypothetical protein [Moorena sp. SIO4E2]